MATETHADTQMPLRVAAIADVADGIRSFELVQPDGSELPPFTPGSHVKVQTPSGNLRKYSLCNDPAERHRYVIAVKREDGSWLMDGLIPIPELKDRLDLREAPEEDRGRYNTLSGMVMLLLGRVPRTADHVEWESWRFEIVDMDGKRIDKVLVTRITGPELEVEPPADGT